MRGRCTDIGHIWKVKILELKQIVKFNMCEMEYKGGLVKSESPFILLEDEYYEQYKALIDDCFYEMRKALDVRPYEKHSDSLEHPEKLKENTFILLSGEEIICAVTCSENYIGKMAVSQRYRRQGYGRKALEFALSYMQKRGDFPIALTVAKWNKNAIAMYESTGLVITKESTVAGVNVKKSEDIWTFEFTATDDINLR